VGQNYAYYLVIAESIFNRPAVQAFRQWLLEEARTEAPARVNSSASHPVR
jgi:DNA-binding transcriptional LysR family regulator